MAPITCFGDPSEMLLSVYIVYFIQKFEWKSQYDNCRKFQDYGQKLSHGSPWSHSAYCSVNFVKKTVASQIFNVIGAQKWLGIFESDLAVKYVMFLAMVLKISWQRGSVEFYKCDIKHLFSYELSLSYNVCDFIKHNDSLKKAIMFWILNFSLVNSYEIWRSGHS